MKMHAYKLPYQNYAISIDSVLKKCLYMYVDTLKWPKNKIIRGIDVCLKVQSRKGSLSTVKLKYMN